MKISETIMDLLRFMEEHYHYNYETIEIASSPLTKSLLAIELHTNYCRDIGGIDYYCGIRYVSDCYIPNYYIVIRKKDSVDDIYICAKVV